MRSNNLSEMIFQKADRFPERSVFLNEKGCLLSYLQLAEQIVYVKQQFARMGIGSDDVVAIVLPNGPELALTFLATAACAASAPLNPAYGAQEFEFFLSDLGAKAIILLRGDKSAARHVAERIGISVIDLVPNDDGKGLGFTLQGSSQSGSGIDGFAQMFDTALMLHTSGTTSRPKLVPLTQANILASARNIISTLSLVEEDRCINLMPLFHIHGLMAVVLSSVMAGASVICLPGFDVHRFYKAVELFHPTWYSAVPTIHQAVLEGAERYQTIIQNNPLRFIRSSSASLPGRVMLELEKVFSCPVIEAYGMTEAAHQMASNPLPPKVRKPNSVGLPAGPEIGILDQAGKLLDQNETGEIVIRGPNVMRGYINNPEANQTTFCDGWFRTGDEGYFDVDGYLFITGRIKEIINRGGEKVVPREVDEVFLNHPSVYQAVTFAIPHQTLGEDVVAAVVLRANEVISPRELRAYAFEHLADYKVPSQVIILEEIPKGPTGKLQRIGLAKVLADKLAPEFTPVETKVQQIVLSLWHDILSMKNFGLDDNFFACGGDSLSATRLAARIQAVFEIDYPLGSIFRNPSIYEQAEQIEKILIDEIEAQSDGESG
jgi:oxalate---CoA ligase